MDQNIHARIIYTTSSGVRRIMHQRGVSFVLFCIYIIYLHGIALRCIACEALSDSSMY